MCSCIKTQLVIYTNTVGNYLNNYIFLMHQLSCIHHNTLKLGEYNNFNYVYTTN